MKVYIGERTPDGCVIRCLDKTPGDMRILSIEPSLKLINHSPTGFEWGYGGSGPSQTALAILLDYYKDEQIALKYYQAFKQEMIVGMKEELHIFGSEIDACVNKLQQGEQ